MLVDTAPSELLVKFNTMCVNGVVTIRSTPSVGNQNVSDQSNEGCRSPDINHHPSSCRDTPRKSYILGGPDNFIYLTTSSTELHFEDLDDAAPYSPVVRKPTTCTCPKHENDKSECLSTKSQVSQVREKHCVASASREYRGVKESHSMDVECHPSSPPPHRAVKYCSDVKAECVVYKAAQLQACAVEDCPEISGELEVLCKEEDCIASRIPLNNLGARNKRT